MTINRDIAPHKDNMISTTLVVVIITTIVLGGLMSAITKMIGLQKESVADMRSTSYANTFTDKPGQSKNCWRKFDDRFIKPCFGGDIRGKKKTFSKAEVAAMMEQNDERYADKI